MQANVARTPRQSSIGGRRVRRRALFPRFFNDGHKSVTTAETTDEEEEERLDGLHVEAIPIEFFSTTKLSKRGGSLLLRLLLRVNIVDLEGCTDTTELTSVSNEGGSGVRDGLRSVLGGRD